MLSCNSPSRSFSGNTVAPLILALGLTVMSAIAFAQPVNVTREEMAMLPRYCPYTQLFGNSGEPGSPSPGAKPWVAMMGDGFWTVHHYCWGLINSQRAAHSRTPPQTRMYLLGSAREDYLYVVTKAPGDFILLPEIYTALGKIELQLARPNEANRSFARARALKPDYWPAYSHWADFLIKAGRMAEAKPLVKSGLEYSPKSKTLGEQYRLLGGKLSEIVPRVQEPPPGDAAGETIDPVLAEEPAE